MASRWPRRQRPEKSRRSAATLPPGLDPVAGNAHADGIGEGGGVHRRDGGQDLGARHGGRRVPAAAQARARGAAPAAWTPMTRGTFPVSPRAFNSRNALATEETMQPSPTGTRTASGRVPSPAREPVGQGPGQFQGRGFLAFDQQGLWAQLRLYQPFLAISTRDSSKAWS